MFRNVSDIAAAYDEGGHEIRPFIKVWPSTFSTATAWYDGTLSGTYPRASYYPGDDYVFTVYPSGAHLSHFNGGNVSPAQKVIKSIYLRGSSTATSSASYILCDYLGFYQGISWETGDQQDLVNTVTLPRYTDGKGVKAFFVQLFGSNSGSIATMTYTNQNGDSKVSQTIRGNTLGTGATQNASIANTYLPFVELAANDTGIRSVQSVTVTGLGTGIAVLVLVKPICTIILNDIYPTAGGPGLEKDFFQDNQQLPIIKDGACLNLLVSGTASMSGATTLGYIEYIWH